MQHNTENVMVNVNLNEQVNQAFYIAFQFMVVQRKINKPND